MNVSLGDTYIRLNQDNYIQFFKESRFVNDVWHGLTTTEQRFYFTSSGPIDYKGGDGTVNGTSFSRVFRRNAGDADIFRIKTNGSFSYVGTIQNWSDSRIKKDIEDINDDNVL